VNVLFIDNFDSFTFNLVDELCKRGCKVDVWRNSISAGRALELARALPRPRLIVLSPGPSSPAEAGCCIELIQAARGEIPLFGVCLGHQAICAALGGRVARAPRIVHGKASAIRHDQQGPFAGLPSPMRVGRYHSLAAVELVPALSVRAVTADDDATVMAMEDTAGGLFGVQFHPESILTPHGGHFISNVLSWAQAR
jgi:anthranilate synthase component 2